MALKDRLKDQAVNALAALHGVADETTFGGTTWAARKLGAGEKLKQLEEENPWAGGAGRVGSYFIPGAGWVKLATKVPKAGKYAARGAQLASKGMDAVKGLPGMANMLKMLGGPSWKSTIASGGLGGLVSGEAQHLVRKMTGADDDVGQASSTGDRMLTETVFGMGGSALGRLISKVAPVVYNHPALFNKNKIKESRQQAKKLLEEGAWGSLSGGLTDKADELRGKLGAFEERLKPKLLAREAEDLAELNKFSKKHSGRGKSGKAEKGSRAKGIIDSSSIKADKRALTGRTGKYNQQMRPEAELKNTNSAFNRLEESLDPDRYGGVGVDNIFTASKNMNERIADLSSQARAKAFGDPGLGEVNANIDTALAGRKTLQGLKDKAIQMLGDPGDLAKQKSLTKEYRRGADLNENILNWERQQKQPFFTSGILRNAAHATIASAPIRTAAGVLLDRAAPRIKNTVGGRIGELRSRGGKKEPEPIDVEAIPVDDESSAIDPNNPFLEDLPPEAVDGAKPIDHPDVEASRKKLYIKPKDLEAIRNMPKRRATSEEWRVEEEDEENPFLQDVLVR